MPQCRGPSRHADSNVRHVEGWFEPALLTFTRTHLPTRALNGKVGMAADEEAPSGDEFAPRVPREALVSTTF
jgi:hypothetical protein